MRIGALSLLASATAVFGGTAVASARELSPSVTSAASVSCPLNRICFWSGSNFTGTRIVVRPVPSGECRQVGDPATHSQASVANASRGLARVWEYEFGGRCGGRNVLVLPGRTLGRLSFGVAQGLGGY
jgi:hypothetical protein